MRIKIQKWGNSLALRIPKAFAIQTMIRQDEYVNLTLEDQKIIIEPEEKKYTLDELVAWIKKRIFIKKQHHSSQIPGT